MRDRAPFDFPILLVTLILMGLGIVMVYSASAILAAEKFNDSLYFLKKQVLFGAGGVLLMVIAMNLNYHVWQKLAYPILGLSFVFLVLVLTVGTRAGGSTRWLQIGSMSFQPSEFSKLALVIFLSYFLAKKGERIRAFRFGFLPTILIAGAMIFLVIQQPDFGVALFLGILAVLMLYVGYKAVEMRVPEAVFMPWGMTVFFAVFGLVVALLGSWVSLRVFLEEKE